MTDNNLGDRMRNAEYVVIGIQPLSNESKERTRQALLRLKQRKDARK